MVITVCGMVFATFDVDRLKIILQVVLTISSSLIVTQYFLVQLMARTAVAFVMQVASFWFNV